MEEDQACTAEMEDKPSLLLSFHTEIKQEPLESDCDSGAQCSLGDSEMTSVKQEDCSQTLGLNVIIKDEEEEEEIGDLIKQDGFPEMKKCSSFGRKQHKDYKGRNDVLDHTSGVPGSKDS
ncbi:uncharacterized protein LOC105027439 isoform X3 [Esox lucius]|uniref:uncharacterized protein LOC105027439 isoform X3 n=1 Tax=Esox lucius TaxID=8010 RepID=UPI001476D37D|nr:uncharacterized protein LOC105027439 isoform X3 [Esox lucius]